MVKEKSVSDIYSHCLKIMKERKDGYKYDYRDLEKILVSMFPEPITIGSSGDENVISFNKIAFFIFCVVKLHRLAGTKINHLDSAIDLCNYSAMLATLMENENVNV